MEKDIRLPKETKYLWQIRIAFPSVALLIIFAFLCRLSPWLLIPLALTAVSAVFLIFWYIPLFIKNYCITIKNDAFVISTGVFLKTTYIMPYPRMIYVSSFSSPIARKYGICAVVMRAVRGFIFVPEIKIKDVEMISSKAEGTSDG